MACTRGFPVKWCLPIVAVQIFFLLSSALSQAKEDENSVAPLDERFIGVMKSAEHFPQVPRDIDFSRRTHALDRILSSKISDILVVDDELVRKHFSGLDDSRLRAILQRWNLPAFDSDQYVSVPFYIDIQKEKPRFVTSSKIVAPGAVPAASGIYYTAFLKAYAALPKPLIIAPSAWSHGLSSLAAQDFFYPTSMASCPDLEIETAIAALLFHKDEGLLWDAYPEEGAAFDKESYLSRLKSAIGAAGSAKPEEALKELLRSPEEYYAYGQKEVKSEEGKPKEERAPVPPIHPAMRILWMILPDSPEGLRSAADYAMANVADSTLRLVLLNACYDKLSALAGGSGKGAILDPTTLITNAAEGSLQGAGVDGVSLLKEFEGRRDEAWRVFTGDLERRAQTGERLEEMAYDPSTLKWTFQFLYNYSLTIRQKLKEFREGLRGTSPGMTDAGVDENVAKEITAEKILEWWRSDRLIAALFDKVGEPDVKLHESQSSKTGKVIECCWRLKRKGTGDSEEVRIEIFDPFSSGGGKPKEGVSGKALVVVRKDLNSPPETIELKDIKENFFIRTTDNLDDAGAMREDWARVKAASDESTSMPWRLDSGAGQPLLIGRKQAVLADLSEGKGWTFTLPLPLRANKDKLLGIRPEGPVPAGAEGAGGGGAAFSPALIVSAGAVEQDCKLITIELSHREMKAIAESGADVWGYFADGRFVAARVFPAAEGVDGKALIESSKGEKTIDSLKAARSKEEEGEEVSAFQYFSPNTFIDRVKGRPSQLADYTITISYTLPNGQANSIRVAEGQKLVVVSSRGQAGQKKAYQLKRGDLLVCGFRADKSPVTAQITSLEGREEELGAYTIKLKTLPLVRVNGILIPVEVEGEKVWPGIIEDSVVQLSPSLDVVRQSSPDAINLDGSRGKNAGDVVGGDLILAYNMDLEPRRTFCQLEIADKEVKPADRYVRIITARGTLECGHLQGVYRTKSGWEGVRLTEAGVIDPGDRVVWLHTKEGDMAREGGRAAGDEAAAAPAKGGAAAAGVETKIGAVELIEVTGVQVMYATKDRPSIRLHSFFTPETAKDVLGYKPNMFANGILVSIDVLAPGEGDEKGRGDGRMKGERVRPERPGGKGFPRPATSGPVREHVPPQHTIAFDGLEQIKRNRAGLETAFGGLRLNAADAREGVLSAFLGQYFAEPVRAQDLYDNIRTYLGDYLQSRDFLLSTGNPRVLAGFVNSYVFLATLVYEANGKEAGDALTRDFLSIATRAIKGGDWPSGNVYADQKFRVREGLVYVRDLVLYIRDRNTADGFEPVANVKVSTESFDDVLKYFTEEKKLSPDILSENNVNLYNLCRQLDHHFRVPAPIGDSIIAPGFKASDLFGDRTLRSRLGLKGEERSEGNSSEEESSS